MEIILIIIIVVSIFAGYTTGVMMKLKEINKKNNEIADKDNIIEKLTKQRDAARYDYDFELKRNELKDKQIETILEQNSYDRDDIKIAKLRELVDDWKSNN